MANITPRLTPFSRLLITAAIVAGIFLSIKTFFASSSNSSDNADSQAVLSASSGAEAILKLSGSSTLGAKMMPQIAQDFMRDELKASDIKLLQISDTEAEIVGTIGNKQQMISISTLGSMEGIADLTAQKADIALFSGNPEGINSAFTQAVIGLDGIAIITNNANKIKDLTKTQVADIFAGKINNWSQVGGESAAIVSYGRDIKSGTSEAFKQMVFDNASIVLPPSVTVFTDSKKLVQAIENEPNAIGFTSFSNIGNTQALGLSDLGTGVRNPSVFTIETEDYLLTRRLYLVAAANDNSLTPRFIAYCNSNDKGQKTVASSGFVNMDLATKITQTVIADAPPAYLAATKEAMRLPTTLHFQQGSSQPDVRATEDLKRIMQTLSAPENRQKKVLLIGFTDNLGNPTQNISLSMQRAKSIQTEFAKFGVQVETTGFGQALPIASNATLQGKNKNRRVEVWIK